MGVAHRPMIVLGIAVAINMLAVTAQAQRDDVVVDDNATVDPSYLLVRREAILMELRIRAQAARGKVTDDAVQQHVFGDASTRDAVVSQLEALLRTKVDEWCRLCGANDEQKAKLELAGRVDIGRFLERLDDLKRQAVEANGNSARTNDLYHKSERLRSSLNTSFFGDDSLLIKTSRTLLTSQQVDGAYRQATARQHRAQLEPAIALLKDALNLTDQQERALVDLMLAEARPPRQPGRFIYAVTLFEMRRLPEKQLKPLLNEQQWELLRRQFEQVKWLEPSLREDGFLREN